MKGKIKSKMWFLNLIKVQHLKDSIELEKKEKPNHLVNVSAWDSKQYSTRKHWKENSPMRGRRGGEAGGVDNYSIKQCTELSNIFQYKFYSEKSHVFSLLLKADVANK